MSLASFARSLNVTSLLRRAGLAGPAPVIERLESREFLSAVSWDGGASTANWHDALNWSNDAVPTVADDVTIAATALASINFTATTGARSVNSLNSAENLNFSGGTLTVVTTATTTAPVTLAGGTLSGGAWSPSSLSASSGTLSNVALSGDINVAAFGTVNVTGSTTFSVAHVVDSADIRFAPGYVLNSTVRAEGTGGNTRQVFTTAAGTLTIGATGVIELAAGTAGGLNLGSSNTTIINNGTIVNNAASRALTINATSTTNNNILSATAGTITINGTWSNAGSISGTNATLNFNGAWSTTGSVTINNTTLNLEGTFTTAGLDLADFNRTGGTVNLAGVLTNSGLTLNAATGSWNLTTGGAINGGTLAYADGAQLLATLGTLNNVAVLGDVFLNTFGSMSITGSTTFNVAHLVEGTDIRFAPGYVLNSTVRAEGTGGSTRQLLTIGAGTLTVGATGLIELAAGTLSPFTVGSSNTTLINNGTIVNNAAGRTLTINATSTTNNNIISANAGTITIGGTWSNAGSISGTNATLTFNGAWSSTGSVTINNTTLNLDGTFTTAGMDLADFNRTGGTVNLSGVLTNSGLTLNAATGSWNLISGGTISGGTLAYAGGAQLLATNGTLNNVAVSGDLFFNAFGFVNVLGSTTFNVAHLIEGTDIRFAPGYVLNSTVRAEGTGGNTRQVLTTAAGSLTIGATGLIELAAGTASGFNVGSSNTTLINNGTIINNAAGRALTINATSTTNNNFLSATTGTLTINGTWSNAGSISGTNATLNFNGAWSTTGSVTINNTTLNLDGTFTTAGMDLADFTRTGGTVNLSGVLTNSALTLNAATGSWNLIGGGTINGGTLSYAGGAQLLATNGTLNNVAVSGDLFFNAFGFVNVLGSTTFNVAHLIESTDIRFAPGYVLNSTVRAEGPGGNTRQVLTTTTGTLTIGATGLIELAAGTAAGLNVGGNNTTLVNNGTIVNNATSRTLTINATSTTNNNILSATNGTLTINGTWSNAGSISGTNATLNFNGAWSTTGSVTINNTTLNLNGTFTTAGMDLADFNRTGGTVNLGGVLTNSGLTLNATTGSWNLTGGGTINGGTLAYTNGAQLLATNGTLNNVAVLGDLFFNAFGFVNVLGTTTFTVAHLIDGVDIRFAPGYVLNSTVRAEGTGGNTRQVLTTATGTLTIGATGLIELAAGTAAGLNIGSNTVTLVNNGTIASNAAGRTVTTTAGTITNLSGTTLTGGTWRAGGGTLNLGAGRNVTVNAANLVLDGTTSSIAGLTGFVTNNGTLTLAGTKDLAVGAFTNNGTITLNAGSELTVTGSFTQSASGALHLFVAGTGVTEMGRVLATTTVSLAGSWTVGAQNLFIPAYGTIFDLVIGGSRAGLFGGFASGGVPGGRFLELYTASAARVTFERATGLWTGLGDGVNWSDPNNWYNNTLPGPTDDAFISLAASDPSIVVNSGVRSVGSVFSTESITVAPVATLALGSTIPSRFEAAFNNNGTVTVSNEAAFFGGGTHTGAYGFDFGAIVQLNGTHDFTAASSLGGAGTAFVFGGTADFSGFLSPGFTLGILSGATASLHGDYSLEAIINSGTLDIGSNSITLSGAYSQTFTGTLAVDLVDATTIGTVSAGIAALSGGLSVSSSTGFDPSNPMLPLFGINVVNSANTFGSVALTSAPAATVGSFVARSSPSGARLLHNAADFNGDGGVDGDDVIAFFDAWDNAIVTADMTGDGGVDGDDVIFFFGLWDNGGV